MLGAVRCNGIRNTGAHSSIDSRNAEKKTTFVNGDREYKRPADEEESLQLPPSTQF